MMKAELVANYQNAEINEKALNKDHQSVVSDADDLLREISSATVETLALARAKIEEKLSNAKSSVEAARISITGKAQDAADNVYGYVAENPWKVVGIAAAAAVAGVIVGVVLNRR
jgi:ElaB/YqjD/DUF883 family membrane-anchored ribosome-binding protein